MSSSSFQERLDRSTSESLACALQLLYDKTLKPRLLIPGFLSGQIEPDHLTLVLCIERLQGVILRASQNQMALLFGDVGRKWGAISIKEGDGKSSEKRGRLQMEGCLFGRLCKENISPREGTQQPFGLIEQQPALLILFNRDGVNGR